MEKVINDEKIFCVLFILVSICLALTGVSGIEKNKRINNLEKRIDDLEQRNLEVHEYILNKIGG